MMIIDVVNTHHTHTQNKSKIEPRNKRKRGMGGGMERNLSLLNKEIRL